jgi:rhamnosyltransferase
MISVVVRTKNEERWIGSCLRALELQDWDEDDFEIIVVDNESTDATVDIAKGFRCRIVTISDEAFTFGRAINVGIREARGGFIAILSGHCIPINDKWMEHLALPFTDPAVAGVYGRQEPLPDTSDFDRRDLWTTFGIERRVQTKDYLFHNANCMIRRATWDTLPFDEEIPGVEDRHWARHVLEWGYVIVYEPNASVYHYHGIHQGRDEQRAARVARVIEFIQRGRQE